MAKKLESEILKDLPVNTISDEVINNVTNGVQIVSSPTGSGKTLTIPAKWADRLPEGERVVVLVPRRFLAINAAETVAELSDTTLGEEVGYAVGTQGGDEPLYGKNSKIVFMTYGYAISSGALMYEKNIVLDEVHEASMDISIVKALLQNRKKEDDTPNIIEMSATIDLDKQVNYWNEFNPTAHQCEGKTFGCEIIEEEEKSEAEMAVELIKDHGRKGIAIFQSGKREIEEVVEELNQQLEKNNLQDVEIASIYGEMDSQERRKALAAPAKGKKKIIIGTNVIESGMNIPWLDAGISSGKGKGLYATSSGAVVLKEDNLPQWRLQQQKGRVCRFTAGVFVLAANTRWEDRPVQTVAEISRLPLTELVLSCAKFGLKTEELHFDARIDSDQLALAKRKLLRLRLIDEDNKITDLGKYVTNLPVSPETGLILKYAQSREYCLPQAIVLAGVMEQGTLRQSFNWSHDQSTTSDIFDGMLAFVRVEKQLAELRKRNKFKQENNKNKTFAQKLKEKEKSASELEDEAISYPKREEIFKSFNVSKKRFYEAREAIKDLSKRFKVRVDLTDDNFDFDKLKQCMMAGHISKLHLNSENIFNGDSYNFSQGSVLSGYSIPRFLATAKVITPRNGRRPFTILDNITGLSENDITKFFSKNRDLISKIDNDGEFKVLDSQWIDDQAITDMLRRQSEERKQGLDQIKEALCERIGSKLRLNSNEELISEMQEYLAENRENLPLYPTLEEIGIIKTELFEERQAQNLKYQSDLQDKKCEIENKINLYIEQEEKNSGLIISAADLGKFVDDTYRQDEMAQEIISSFKRQALLETEERRTAREEEVKLLRSIYYEAIAEEITNQKGKIVCHAGDSPEIKRRLFNVLSEKAGEEDLKGWEQINITGTKPQPGEDLLTHNLNFMETQYVVPDIMDNRGRYDPKKCSYEMNRSQKALSRPDGHNDSTQGKINKARKVLALAGAWGASVFSQKGGGRK